MSHILAISDIHEPFGHPDACDFLKELKRVCGTDETICLGDELDSHGLGRWEKDPDGYSAGDELRAGRSKLKAGLFKVFPKARVCRSNHTERYFKAAFRAGIPAELLKDYSAALEAPSGWTWHDEITVDGVCYAHEWANSEINGLGAAYRMGMPLVQGHIHSKGCVVYGNSRRQSVFFVIGGCLIDFERYAFHYARSGMGRPVLGTPTVDRGRPHFHRMNTDKHGRWTGKI